MLDVTFDEYFLDGGNAEGHWVIINNIRDYWPIIYFNDSVEPRIEFRESKAFWELAEYTFREVSQSISEYSHSFKGFGNHISEIFTFPAKLSITTPRVEPDALTAVYAEFNSNPGGWVYRHPAFVIKEVINKKTAELTDAGIFQTGFKFLFSKDYEYAFIWIVQNPDAIIKNEITAFLNAIAEVFNSAHEALKDTIDKDILNNYFNFPESIKSACCQYLIYFGQFLADLGIKAELDITNEPDATILFQVIPTDKTSSLVQIKEMLNNYLTLPAIDVTQFTINHADVAPSQLLSNILHLQSQLMLAKSALQMKDATIQTLQLNNYQYQQIIETKTKSDKEDLIPGIVSVGRIEKVGVTLHLAELLRKLKRAFK